MTQTLPQTEVDTKYGKVVVTYVTEEEISISCPDFHGESRPIRVNGVEYRIRVNVTEPGSDGRPRVTHYNVTRASGFGFNDGTSAAKKIVLDLARKLWVDRSHALSEEAGRAQSANRIERLEQDIARLQEEIAEKQAEIASLAFSDPVKREAP